MPSEGVFESIPLWLLFLTTIAMSLVVTELGFRYGRYRLRSRQEEKETTVGAMVAAELGLLAFLLAFTFSLAAGRFDSRREAVLNEANAIGTAYLRAGLLAEPQRTELRALFREYVNLRVPGDRPPDVREIVTKSEQLHEKLWTHATAATQASPGPITALFVQALNEVIDMHSVRVTLGMHSQIPGTVWATLYLVAVLTMGSVGFHAGLSGTCRSLIFLTVILSFSTVMLLVEDLDRPREGLLKTSQQPMIDLQKSVSGP